MRTYKPLLTLLLTTVTTAPAATFSSFGAFNAAIAGQSASAETFGELAPGQAIPVGATIGRFAVSSYNLTQGATQGIVDDVDNSLSGQSLGADHTGLAPSLIYFFAGEGFTLTFSQPINSVGILFNVSLLATGSFRVSAAGQTATTLASAYDPAFPNGGTFVFAGLTSATSFRTATITGSDSYNVPEILTSSAVPEPAAVLPVSFALLVFAGVVLRRRAGQPKLI